MGDTPNFRFAYDANTGKKLPNKVPEQWFDIFSNLRETPKQRAEGNSQEKPNLSLNERSE